MGLTPYHQTRQVEDSINERSIFILAVSAQLLPGEFEEVMETRPPRLMICSVEFLASEEVRTSLYKSFKIENPTGEISSDLY